PVVEGERVAAGGAPQFDQFPGRGHVRVGFDDHGAVVAVDVVVFDDALGGGHFSVSNSSSTVRWNRSHSHDTTRSCALGSSLSISRTMSRMAAISSATVVGSVVSAPPRSGGVWRFGQRGTCGGGSAPCTVGRLRGVWADGAGGQGPAVVAVGAVGDGQPDGLGAFLRLAVATLLVTAKLALLLAGLPRLVGPTCVAARATVGRIRVVEVLRAPGR